MAASPAIDLGEPLAALFKRARVADSLYRRHEGRLAELEDDGDGPLGEHHGARGFDHPPSDCESDDGFCEDDGFY